MKIDHAPESLTVSMILSASVSLGPYNTLGLLARVLRIMSAIGISLMVPEKESPEGKDMRI